MDDQFDPIEYWKNRHKDLKRNSRSVGDISLSQAENDRIYENFNNQLVAILKDIFLETKILPVKVLDAGCGTGLNIPAFQEVNFEYTGVDISDIAIEQADKNFTGHRFFLHDFCESRLEKTENQFDCVFIRTVLIHVIDDSNWKQFLANVTRQLKPGGILIIVDGFPEKRERPAIHVVKRSFKEYTSELENLNYKVTRIEHYQNCIVAEKRV